MRTRWDGMITWIDGKMSGQWSKLFALCKKSVNPCEKWIIVREILG